MKVIVLPLGEEHYAFALDSVQQVISAPRVTRLPVADAALLGLVNVRGEIVPLFDLAVLTGDGEERCVRFRDPRRHQPGPGRARCRGDAGVGGDRRGAASDGPEEEPRVYPVAGRLVTLLEIEILLVKGRAGLPRAS